MKIIKLLLLICMISGCATLGSKQEEPVRNYPIFLEGDSTSAAFKIQTSYKGQELAAVLLLTKVNGERKVKIMGDFATTILEGVYKNNRLYYSYILNNMLDKKGQKAFEDVIRILLSKPTDFANASVQPNGEQQINFREGGYIYRYHFKKGLSFPYKVEEIKRIVLKKVVFDDYQIFNNQSLPSKIMVEDGMNIFKVELLLISVK